MRGFGETKQFRSVPLNATTAPGTASCQEKINTSRSLTEWQNNTNERQNPKTGTRYAATSSLDEAGATPAGDLCRLAEGADLRLDGGGSGAGLSGGSVNVEAGG